MSSFAGTGWGVAPPSVRSFFNPLWGEPSPRVPKDTEPFAPPPQKMGSQEYRHAEHRGFPERGFYSN